MASPDALVLASSHEGIANVLLESMACGTPVVASRICGTPEVVNVPEAGRLFDTADGGVIAECIQSLPLTAEFRAATRAHAERFGWDGTSRGLACVLRRVITRAKAA